MTELLLPRLKQEIETRLAELRPLIAEIEQLEAAKAALLDRGDIPAALALAAPARRRSGRNGGQVSAAAAAPAAPTRRRRAAAPRREAAEGERAPRGANRDAIVKLVEERPGVSVAEIASVTKIAKPTVATTVSKLKREGVFADEAGGVKLASRQPLTISGPAEEAAAAAAPAAEAAPEAAPAPAAKRRAAKPAARRARRAKKPARRDEGASDAEWDEAAPAGDAPSPEDAAA